MKSIVYTRRGSRVGPEDTGIPKLSERVDLKFEIEKAFKSIEEGEWAGIFSSAPLESVTIKRSKKTVLVERVKSLGDAQKLFGFVFKYVSVFETEPDVTRFLMSRIK